jgi:hypothetical protein
LLGPKDLTAAPAHARVCGDCGHIIFFLGADDLARVRAVIR